jgi:hypothetical protein
MWLLAGYIIMPKGGNIEGVDAVVVRHQLLLPSEGTIKKFGYSIIPATKLRVPVA